MSTNDANMNCEEIYKPVFCFTCNESKDFQSIQGGYFHCMTCGIRLNENIDKALSGAHLLNSQHKSPPKRETLMPDRTVNLLMAASGALGVLEAEHSELPITKLLRNELTSYMKNHTVSYFYAYEGKNE